MLPKLILHNSISVDGSLTDFMPNMELHYRIAGDYKAQAHLIGSKTMSAGFDIFNQPIPVEEESDFKKPNRYVGLPYWVTPNSTGSLKGILHACRRFEYCKDIIVLVSEQTPQDYIDYLKERNYDYLVVGKTKVDLKRSLELLSEKYGVKTVLADTGRVLGSILLNDGLVNEVSILVHPTIVGPKTYHMFVGTKNMNLTLKHNETFDGKYVWLVYDVASS